MQPRNYTVQTQIARPDSEVYQAIVDEQQLSQYFVEKSSGPLREGSRIVWNWGKWGDYPVTVKTMIPNQRIEFELNSTEWKKTTENGYGVLVIVELETLSENSTMLSISESGWLHDEPGYKASHDNCGGWTHMQLCLKAYLEYGIDLRCLSPIPPA